MFRVLFLETSLSTLPPLGWEASQAMRCLSCKMVYAFGHSLLFSEMPILGTMLLGVKPPPSA